MDWIELQKVAKSFGARELFRDVTFTIRRGDRIGLVGPNGVGKSTLLRCILGLEEIDGGLILRGDGVTIGYLKQDVDLGEESLREVIEAAWADVAQLESEMAALHKVLEEPTATARDLQRLARLQERFELLGGYEYESMTRKIVYSLGFTDADLDTPANAFSGGQKTRINMAKALVRRPDFLLLDEPTNHLDMEMLEWLEGYLSGYQGGILVVSHDRYFLDRVTTGIVELNHEKAISYKGNYSRYLSQKSEREKAQQRAYEKQQAHIKETEAYIDRYRAGIKSKMARGRQSQLDRLERIEAVAHNDSLSFTFPKPPACADKVLVMNDVTVGYEDRALLDHVKLMLRRGESVALIGANGAGKTTMLKAILGELPLWSGHIQLGDRVQVGYFSQEHDELRPDWTVLEEILYHTSLSEGAARNVLGRFLFRGDAVFRKVGDLSGGEKARLALLKLFLEGDNFLVLDEPTNHLDIPTREVVEQALREFGGTYLVISHDRYFLDAIAKRTLQLAEGHITEYLGNYSYFKEKVAEKEALLAATEEPSISKSTITSSRQASMGDMPNRNTTPKEDTKATKAPKVNDYMREKRLAQLEMDIARLEATCKMYEVQIQQASLAGDTEILLSLTPEMQKTEEALSEAYERWEVLMDMEA